MKKSNIEVTYDYKDFVVFHTTCKCGDTSHILGTVVEDDDENPYPQVALYFPCGRFEVHRTWINLPKRICKRIIDACKILFTGKLDVDDEFMFREESHVKDFRSALDEAINQVEDAIKSKEAKV